jgi:hypothetical protein
MIVMNEAENSILVHSKDDGNQVTITDYLQAIQSCGFSNLVVEPEVTKVTKNERYGNIAGMSEQEL